MRPSPRRPAPRTSPVGKLTFAFLLDMLQEAAAIDARHPRTTRLIVTHGNEAAWGAFDATADLTAWRPR